MKKTIHVLEHMEFPGPDAGLQHLSGADLRLHRPDLGGPLPALEGASGLMVMGGPQMVTDIADLPWMQAEAALLREAVSRGLPTLCVCLGAQILAHAFGGTIAPDPEGRIAFGFHAVASAGGPIPSGLHVLSGNAQGFNLPEGAQSLATAVGPWPNQAFRLGPALALQFHPEVTRPILTQWQDAWPELHDRPGAHPRSRQDADFARHDPALKSWYRGQLDALFGV